jgi:hypothetical protein
MVYPLESGRKKKGIRAIWDTGKCLEVRAQLHTDDPSLSGFILEYLGDDDLNDQNNQKKFGSIGKIRKYNPIQIRAF